MSELSKNEIDELLSGAVDDTLSQRQQTELKRLLGNHPELADVLAALQRQRQLLCALPIETAPPTLVDEVKQRMERKLILADASHGRTLRSRTSLWRRRIVAAAAMLFLPLALLGYVVYQIMAPFDAPHGRQTARALLEEDAPAVAIQPPAPEQPTLMPFDGLLVLTADRPLLVAKSIEKQIFLKALEHQTLPNRTAETTTFQIDCPADLMADFVGALRPLWNELADARLTVRDGAEPDRTVVVDHIRPEQIQTLARQTDKMPMLSAARQYAAGNTQHAPQAEDIVTPDQLDIPMPALAWPTPDDTPVRTSAGPHIRLTIEVRRHE